MLGMLGRCWGDVEGGVEDVTKISDRLMGSFQMVHTADTILGCSEEEYSTFELTWRTVNSAEEEIDLIPNGSKIDVCYEERHEFVERMIHARVNECNKQVHPLFSFFLVHSFVLSFLSFLSLFSLFSLSLFLLASFRFFSRCLYRWQQSKQVWE
jgi:HECT-domain (ubiquitin-transferase)